MERLQSPKRRLPALVAAAAIGVAAIGGALAFGIGGSGDGLSARDAAARAANFPDAIALPLVTAAERDEALDTMALPPEQKAVLLQEVENGDTRLAWLSIWDDRDEDGDAVTVRSGGFSVQLDLYNAPARIGVPIGGDGLTITGVRDGQGGITAGIQADGGPVLTPVLRPGQSIAVGWK